MVPYRALASLAALAALLAGSISLSPHLPGGPLLSALGAFVGACLSSLGAIAFASLDAPSGRVRLAIGAGGAICLAAIASTRSSSVAASVLVDVALVAIALGFGGLIGARVERAGHLLPASVVAACADVVSLASPEGPTHKIVESERALALSAFSFVAPGTADMAPSLGVGDLLFASLLLAACRAHKLSHLRASVALLAGALLAGAGSALLSMPVPALPTIGLCFLAAVPAARRVEAADRRTTTMAITISVGLAVLAVVRARFFA